MLKSHFKRRALQDAALCIPMYEQSRVVNAIFPELQSFTGYSEGMLPEVIEAYALCVQIQTVLFDSHTLLARHLEVVYATYYKDNPVRYWFIGDVVPLDEIAFVKEVNALFLELIAIKKSTPVVKQDIKCLRDRILIVRKWLKAMTALYVAHSDMFMEERALDNELVFESNSV